MNTFLAGWADLLLRWSWQATLLFGLAWLIARRGRAGVPAARYQVWLLTMIAVAALPLCTAIATLVPVQQPIGPLNYVVDLPTVVGIAAEFSVVAPQDLANAQSESLDVVRTIFFAAWSVGFLWNVGRLGGSWWRVHAIRKRARETRLAVLPDVSVDLSPDVGSPLLAGVWNPRILLPTDITEWTTEAEQKGIILHEIAHRERRDHHAILFQRILDAVFFFHPVLRYASKQLSLERELACDAEVLRAGADSGAYADGILKVAERGVQERHSLQPAFNSPRKILERRIEMILNTPHWLTAPTPWHRRIVAAALFAFTATIGVLIPRVEVTATTAPPRVGPMLRPIAEYQPVPAQSISAAQTEVRVRAPQQAPVTPPVVTAPATAQSGTVTGRISDASGAVIPGVRVSITGGRVATTTTATSIEGVFTFRELPEDSYRLEASLPGFITAISSFKLAPAATIRANLTLKLAVVNTWVEVTVERPSQLGNPAAPDTPNTPNTSPPRPIRVGGDVAAPQPLSMRNPQYPATSRAAGIQGTVLIGATIDRSGSVIDLALVSGVDPELDKAALEAVKEWRYKPGLLNGQPIEMRTVITVKFSFSD
jgi:TonB family protein